MASSTETGVKLLSPVVETHSNRWDAGSVFRPVLAWGILGFVTFVVEVLLLSGLRGSASGISALIDSLTVLGAVLTQLLFVSGVILVVHLELLLIRSTAPWPLRALSVPVTSVLCTLLMNAAVGELAVLPLLLLGILATGLALATGIARGLARNDLARNDSQGDPAPGIASQGAPAQGVRAQGVRAQGAPAQGFRAQGAPAQGFRAQGVRAQGASSRHLGLFLILTSLAALLWAAARVSAWQATTLEPPPFDSWAPWLATSAWAVSAGLTTWAFVLLVRAPRTAGSRPPITPVLVGLLATAAGWLVTRPRTFDEPIWLVFLARATQGLLRTPLPVVPPFFVAVEHLLGLTVAAWAFAHRSLPPSHRIAVGFCLLALRAPDTPLLALVLTVGALWVAIPSAPKHA